MKTKIRIESREHLLSVLAEASELEHNLMCLYLYSVFSLKDSLAEGLSISELEAISKWRKDILAVAIEEMAHLALVANLTTAVGGAVHLQRPAFPVRGGFFPADFVVTLSEFDRSTLDHFIFLERPTESGVSRADGFEPEKNYERKAHEASLMSTIGDYETVGELYAGLIEGIEYLCLTLGEENLFCGSLSLQITPEDVKLKGLIQIRDLKTAKTALTTIIEQGEGASKLEDSHFERFSGIAKEYDDILKRNSDFSPARKLAKNPIMRKYDANASETYIDHPLAAKYLDLGNALYTLMLKCLMQVYSMEHRSPEGKAQILKAAFTLMHSFSDVAHFLTELPSSKIDSGLCASLNFAVNRSANPLELKSERKLLVERLREITLAIHIIKEMETIGRRAEALSALEKKLEKLSLELLEQSLK